MCLQLGAVQISTKPVIWFPFPQKVEAQVRGTSPVRSLYTGLIMWSGLLRLHSAPTSADWAALIPWCTAWCWTEGQIFCFQTSPRIFFRYSRSVSQLYFHFLVCFQQWAQDILGKWAEKLQLERLESLPAHTMGAPAQRASIPAVCPLHKQVSRQTAVSWPW